MSCSNRNNAGAECIGVLLSAGADRDLRDADGKTAAHASAEAGRDDCARALAVEMGSTKVGFSPPPFSAGCFWLVLTLAFSKEIFHFSSGREYISPLF